MIEEKLSKINETIPKVSNSSEEKYNIYNEVKNSECNEYDKHHKCMRRVSALNDASYL